jgi:hypothetical protein
MVGPWRPNAATNKGIEQHALYQKLYLGRMCGEQAVGKRHQVHGKTRCTRLPVRDRGHHRRDPMDFLENLPHVGNVCSVGWRIGPMITIPITLEFPNTHAPLSPGSEKALLWNHHELLGQKIWGFAKQSNG